MSNEACAVPLIERLRSVPRDQRQMVEIERFHHRSIPYGQFCHEAADALEELARDRNRILGLLHDATCAEVDAAHARMMEASPWRPIAEMDRTDMQFVFVKDADDGCVRLHLWNPSRGEWERPHPIGSKVRFGDDCSCPTHFMEIPE